MAQPTQVYLNGAVGMVSRRQFEAWTGKYFVVTSVVNTPVAFANSVAYSATANGLWCISNQNPTGGANIVVDRLKLIQTATAPANNLVARAEVYSANGVVTLTGNVATKTPVNINPSYSNATGATVQFFATGAATVPATTGTRLLGVMSLAQSINVRYDSYTFEFASDGDATGKVGVTAVRLNDPADLVCSGPPVVIAPGTSAWMNLWGVAPDTNVPSYEFHLGYSEV